MAAATLLSSLASKDDEDKLVAAALQAIASELPEFAARLAQHQAAARSDPRLRGSTAAAVKGNAALLLATALEEVMFTINSTSCDTFAGTNLTVDEALARLLATLERARVAREQVLLPSPASAEQQLLTARAILSHPHLRRSRHTAACSHRHPSSPADPHPRAASRLHLCRAAHHRRQAHHRAVQQPHRSRHPHALRPRSHPLHSGARGGRAAPLPHPGPHG